MGQAMCSGEIGQVVKVMKCERQKWVFYIIYKIISNSTNFKTVHCQHSICFSKRKNSPELGWVLMALPARHKKLVNCSLGHPGASNMHSHRMRLCWCPVCCSAHGRMVCAVYKIRQSDFLLRSGSVKSDHMHLSVIRAVHFLPPARDALWFHSIME